MAGDKPDVRRKHRRRSPDGGAEEGSKHQKHSRHHSIHRHHHRSRKNDSSKNVHGTQHEGDDLPPPPPPPLVVSSFNSRPDDDKEEGEILEDEDYGVADGVLSKKKEDSDVEFGEIKLDEVVDKSDNWNLGIHGEGDPFLGKAPEEIELNLKPDDDDVVGNSPIDVRDRTDYRLCEYSDGKDVKEIYDEADISRDLRTGCLVSGGREYGMGETDGLSAGFEYSRSREKKGERWHGDSSARGSSSSYVNGDFGHKSQKRDLWTHRGSESPKKGAEVERSYRDVEAGVLRRHGKSNNPVAGGEDVDSKKHMKIDDRGVKTDSFKDAKQRNSVRYVSRRPLESMGSDRNCLENLNKSVIPESTGDRHKTVACSPSHDEAHTRNRSRSRDLARERRSQSQNNLQDGRVHHHESDALFHTDINDRVKPSDSREKAKNESDHDRVVRQDREELHDSRDWVRDKEREHSISYTRHSGLEDRRGSWDTRDRDKERENERPRERERDMDRDRDSNWDRNRNRNRNRNTARDRDRDRRRDGNRERGREKEGVRDGYKDSRCLKHDEPKNHQDRTRSKGPEKVPSFTDDDLKVGAQKRKRDEDEQEDYEERVALKLAEQEEEDIDRIKESRKRKQVILERYKQQQFEPPSEDPGKENGSFTVDKPKEQFFPSKAAIDAIPEGLESSNDGADIDVADPLSSVGKSFPQNGTSAFERIPGAGGLGDGTPKSERSAEKFCDDIFGESPAGVRKTGRGNGLPVERSDLHDNWDDDDGYYNYRFGEILDGRYEVTGAHGKGVYSTVIRAKDLKAGKDDPEEVAIKMIRNNDILYKAGLEELLILKKLARADPEDRRHCVRFFSSFKFRNHLCLVFESLHMNLREVVKKFGRNIGLKLTAVRSYAKQLFIALKHLRNCGVLHSDIKPDNILVNEAKNVLKLCDFGSAMFAGKNEITPYLVSRFYRAPEIILGLPYDHPMDIWSVGCCLYELFSGKVLFPGPSNNDMLRLHMELKGPFPKKMLRKGAFTDQHFDEDLNFHSTEEDPVTKKTVKKLLLYTNPKDIGLIMRSSPGEDPKMLANFKDVLERIFALDPEKRMTVSQALSHPFITGK